MKTLHNIYLQGFYKKVGIGLLIQIVSLGFIASGFSLLEMVGYMAVLVTTLRPFFMHNNFYRNIPHMINRPFSKKELLTFYFYLRTIKFIFFIIPIALSLVFFNPERISRYLEESSYYSIYNGLLVLLLFNYILPIFFIQKKSFKTAPKNLKNQKLSTWAISWAGGFSILGFFAWFSMTYETTSYVLAILVFSLFTCFNFNNFFRLHTFKNHIPRGTALSIIIIFPLVHSILDLRGLVLDKNTAPSAKVDKILTLAEYTPDIKQNDRLLILKSAKAYDYNLLLELGLHKKIPFEQILLTVDSERKKRSLFRRLPPVKSSSDMNLFLKLEAKINPSNEYRTIRLPRIDYDIFKTQEGLSFTKNLLV